MVVKDIEKNRMYVAKHRAMKKANEETKIEYNALNASYISNHRIKQKEELGIDEFKKNNAEYMRQYRAKQKQIKEQTKTTNATTIQSAIRNKLARNALLRQKQDKANEVISKINQQRQAQDQEQTYNKLFASVYANDIIKNMFQELLQSIPERKQRVKKIATRIEPVQAPKKRGRPPSNPK